MEIEFEGGTAQLRDRLNVRGKRLLRAASIDTFSVLRDKFDGDVEKIAQAKPGEIRADGALMDAIDDFNLDALLAFVVSWSLDTPLPSSREEWLNFEDPDIYDALVKLVTPVAYQALNGTAVAATPETVNDPDSPTKPSSD